MLDILSQAEVARVRELVLSRSDSFTHHDGTAGPLPFFTLGPYWGYHFKSFGKTNFYCDNEDGAFSSSREYYPEVVKRTREPLLRDFDFLYDSVKEKLTEFLTENRREQKKANPAKFGDKKDSVNVRWLHEKFSVPAFHVIPSHQIWGLSIFNMHIDEDKDSLRNFYSSPKGTTSGGLEVIPDRKAASGSLPKTLEKFERQCSDESRISFTLAIELPDEENGLNYVDYSDYDEEEERRFGGKCKYDEKSALRWKCGRVKRQRYKEGTMIIHAGKLVHQIGDWKYKDGKKTRITLQGFGYECKDTWVLYW